jgi:phage gp36-like protein
VPSSVYSQVTDLLIGNIPLPQALTPQKYVDDAADEIDSVIGFRYQTPIDMSDLGNVVKPARLLLKRVSNWLATGRIILAVDAAGEDVQLHAYGLKLVSDANDVLRAIADGVVFLDGAVTMTDPDEASMGLRRAPQIANLDEESIVEAFYAALDPRNLTSSFPYSYPYAGG